jgi:hypothetical protein
LSDTGQRNKSNARTAKIWLLKSTTEMRIMCNLAREMPFREQRLIQSGAGYIREMIIVSRSAFRLYNPDYKVEMYPGIRRKVPKVDGRESKARVPLGNAELCVTAWLIE